MTTSRNEVIALSPLNRVHIEGTLKSIDLDRFDESFVILGPNLLGMLVGVIENVINLYPEDLRFLWRLCGFLDGETGTSAAPNFYRGAACCALREHFIQIG